MTHPTTRRQWRARLRSLTAMVASALLLLAAALPARAFEQPDEATPAASTSATAAGSQSVAVAADAVLPPPARDGFQVTSYAQMLQLRYASTSAAYSPTSGAVRWPFPYSVPTTDAFGWRTMCDGCAPEFHKGVDFVPGAGTPIYSIAAGVVIEAQEDTTSGWGNHVIIEHLINGQRVESVYAHMISDSRVVNVGDTVTVGALLGLVGDTGYAFGAHLHLEIHLDGVPVDPYAWLQANAVN